MERIVEVWLAVDDKAELMFEEVEIGLTPWRVGQGHGRHDAQAEHDAGRLFTFDELLQRHDNAAADALSVLSHHVFRGCG